MLFWFSDLVADVVIGNERVLCGCSACRLGWIYPAPPRFLHSNIHVDICVRLVAHTAIRPVGRCRHMQFLHILFVGCGSRETVAGVGAGVIQDQRLVADKGSAGDMSVCAALTGAWVEFALWEVVYKIRDH